MMKNVLLIETGGTVASKESANGLAPSGNYDFLKEASPKVAAMLKPFITNIRRINLFSSDSTNINLRHWREIGRIIAREYDNYQAFVITHGTDTMQFTAAALHYMLKGLGKPIIITGAQVPFFKEESDGPFNLKSSFIAAEKLNGGVYIVFGGKIIRGTSALKIHSREKVAFIDTLGEIGEVTDNEILFHKENFNTGIKAETENFRLWDKFSEKVFYLKLTPFTTGEIFEFIKEKSYRGLVLEVFGLGGVPEKLLLPIGELINSGVRVVAVSQCAFGGVCFDAYRVGRLALENGVEPWEEITGSHALVRLSFLLGAD